MPPALRYFVLLVLPGQLLVFLDYLTGLFLSEFRGRHSIMLFESPRKIERVCKAAGRSDLGVCHGFVA